MFIDGDIYKMHTYKDAIISSIGSYIFYPGTERGVFKEDFEEEDLIPSVGAIPLIPMDNKSNSQILQLSDFLNKVFEEQISKMYLN